MAKAGRQIQSQGPLTTPEWKTNGDLVLQIWDPGLSYRVSGMMTLPCFLKVSLSQEKHKIGWTVALVTLMTMSLPQLETLHLYAWKWILSAVFGYNSCLQTTRDVGKIGTTKSCMVSVRRYLNVWWNYQMHSHIKLSSLRKRSLCHFITQLGYLIHFSLKREFQEQIVEIIPMSANGSQEGIFIIEMIFSYHLFLLYPVLWESLEVLFS